MLEYTLFFLVPTVKETSQTQGGNKETATKPTMPKSLEVTSVTHSTLSKIPLTEADTEGGNKFPLE